VLIIIKECDKNSVISPVFYEHINSSLRSGEFLACLPAFEELPYMELFI
jgi:hypothetical protein